MGHDGRAPNESWFGVPIQGGTGTIERPTDEARIRDILTNPHQYPSPVRPVGSRHSMTECISAQGPGGAGRWGTLVDMTGLVTLRADHPRAPNRSLSVERNAQGATVTVPAGRTFIDVAHELRKDHGLAFRINTELGTLTIGAGACGATKDSSFPKEFGQVCSDVVGMRVVLPSGEVKEYGEGNSDDRDALRALRCSYGLFGIVTEVTFRVAQHEEISIKHERCKLSQFPSRSREWLAGGNAVFLYLFPHDDRIVAELRKKPPTAGDEHGEAEKRSLRLKGRNFFWEKGLHDIARVAENVPGGLDALDEVLERYFVKGLQINRVSPVEQIVDFDKDDPNHRFTFSMWAFPQEEFARILPEYFQFCKDRKAIFRSGLPHVSYHIAHDMSSLLSYSFRGPVWTLDPICPEQNARDPGWAEFLRAFNEKCSRVWRGVPLLNQTPFLERADLVGEFRQRLNGFEVVRRRFDPHDRMLNDYFARLLKP
jgi:FAD/FMN-containing dehydrogenase